MRIAILADIHGNLPALEAVLADLPRHGVDLCINLGDCATAPLWPLETLQLLDTLTIPTVRGNHDRWLVEPPPGALSSAIAFTREAIGAARCRALHALPTQLVPTEDVLAVHGTPHDDCSYLLEVSDGGPLQLAPAALIADRLGPVDQHLILCGHSHTQHMALAPGNRLVVNPGSVGCPRPVGNAAMPLLEASAPHARYAIATREQSGWKVECVALSYDFAAVAHQARRNAHDDWARQFMSNTNAAGRE